LDKEAERERLYTQNLKTQEVIKNDYLQRKLHTTKFTKKLYNISMAKPELWKELKIAEYAIVKGEGYPITDINKQKSMLDDLGMTLESPIEEEILEMGEKIRYDRQNELVQNVLGPETEGLRLQRENAANVINKGLRGALQEKHEGRGQIDPADYHNQDSLMDEYKAFILKKNPTSNYKKSVLVQPLANNVLNGGPGRGGDAEYRANFEDRNDSNYGGNFDKDQTVHWYEAGQMQSYKPNLGGPGGDKGDMLRNSGKNILGSRGQGQGHGQDSYFSNLDIKGSRDKSKIYLNERDYISGLN
jgi:hypothetical protein